MDASKAFDRVSHWLLFKKLIDRGMPLIFVSILMEWYTTKKACVRWGSAVSDSSVVTNGVRQGGILSPLLFNVYGWPDSSSSLSNTPTGCAIGDVMVNHSMYLLMTWSSSVLLLKDCNACWTYVLFMAKPMTFYLMMTRLCVCLCQLNPAFTLTPLPSF